MATAFKKRFLKISGFLIAVAAVIGIFSLNASAEGLMCSTGGDCTSYDAIMSILVVFIVFGIFLLIVGYVLQEDQKKF